MKAFLQPALCKIVTTQKEKAAKAKGIDIILYASKEEFEEDPDLVPCGCYECCPSLKDVLFDKPLAG